jgi:HEAT repeat protein
MEERNLQRLAGATSPAILAGSSAVAAASPSAESDALDGALAALATYDWGTDRETLTPIDEAVGATHGDAAARRDLEARLIAALESHTSRSAKDFICRTLRTIGTAQSVPALAKLLTNEDLSHMARYALERIPAPEAAAAMRDAVAHVSGSLKVGVVGSLGVRRDSASVAALAGLLADRDAAVACAAAHALGVIGNTEAGTALVEAAKTAADEVKPAVTDACLMCAERLLADGNKRRALEIYRSLGGQDQPSHVRLAAKRGLMAVAGK